MNIIYPLLKTAIILFLVDIFWLLTAGIYARNMTTIIQGHPVQMRLLSAAVVYCLLAYMLLQTTSTSQAFIYGCSIYGVYDFTNYALFTKYDFNFAIADTLWGGILFVIARHLIKTL